MGRVLVCLLYGVRQCNADAPSDDPSLASVRNELTRSSAAHEFARSTLKQILSAPEFAQATRTPNAWDRWRQEFSQWLARQLEDLFRAAAQHPTTSQVIFWSLALAALAFIAFQLFRLWNRNDFSSRRAAVQPAITVQYNASRWLAAARAAATRGDFAQAIQCGYWSGISYLQSSHALPDDTVRTPREFLADLNRESAAAEPLRSLTNAVERFWYARQPAGAADWNTCLRLLEAVGCKQD